MNRKLERKKSKLIRRREAKKLFALPLPDSTPRLTVDSMTSAHTTKIPNLTPAQTIIFQELHRFQSDLLQLFLKASQRMLLAGAKEAQTELPKV
jgi:hypothetical protein